MPLPVGVNLHYSYKLQLKTILKQGVLILNVNNTLNAEHSSNISCRAQDMSPFLVMEVLEKAKELEACGRSIIHLEVGEPDFDTPEPIKNAAMKALKDGDTNYTSSLGITELREEICAYYHRRYGVNVSPDQVLVTAGTSPAMLLTFSSLAEPGEEIIIPNPYYACYPNFIRFLNGKPVLVNVDEKDGFKYKIDKLTEHMGSSTKAVVLNSPANPTGAVYSAEEMKQLADSIDSYIVSDEVYSRLSYGEKEHTILEFTDRAFVLNGFSKIYAMTGWRLGYVIAPREYIRPMQKIQQNLFICPASFVQSAGIAALRDCEPYVEEMVRVYDQRRKYLLDRLNKMGLATKIRPEGAFYALANIKKYSTDSFSFAFEILDKTGTALTPGIDFGSNCEGYLRISYANSLENITEGLDRLQNFLESHGEGLTGLKG